MILFKKGDLYRGGMDRYSSFENLNACERRGIDYRIRWRLGSTGVAILSIHGGEIEPGSTRIANAIAGWDHSFYAFEGIKPGGNLALHITSTRFDEPTVLDIVCQSDVAISIHGSAIMTPIVHLGGLDAELKHHIRRELHESGFQATDCIDRRFGATSLKNICNLCRRGMGVQMEISRGLRLMMFQDLTPEGRYYSTAIFTRFTEAVRRAVSPFALIYAETRPLTNTD
ncbi:MULTISPECIES: poly-gamma-glutamate hydrolase family protein [Desulfococcus]|jgi:phage replication-related protein YjqB (UPF0714/DUF867 family)|uniref:Replication protein n=1 Tax=Desulfococcus multivorans DSM 2059 TaxID=1121405 RepID=S7TXP2_DESML|nr:poly-gamma-glutamate hydrolase family protein [Desulfococcus multivorans]AOY56833.1 conserved uncharacterized protein DUF867 [Desulfococcus multivorans]EPR41846.1 protein of unknown function DUF867 [Desulfococcus multivorans DSM 2059]MDX9817487.1 poly-gamma-glutamate hydrolase family protein [Desulfococcus multivorans]SJZ92982.1 Phage-related replication protein YjqB, UPF0714/DUF867 family [Desulfococcus multivorans DSM 2059]